MSDISRTLLIMLAGMGLTFFGMTLLWGMMVLTERFFKEKPKPKAAKEIISKYDTTGETNTLVAVAAVACALEIEKNKIAASAAVASLLARTGLPISRTTPSYVINSYEISSWVVSHRQEQINLRNQVNNRKSRGE